MISPLTVGVRRLVLLRHATAEPGGNGPDTMRSLALAGRKQATRVGRGFTARELLPERVLCSDAVRTRQTWDLLRGGLVSTQQHVTVTPALYATDVEGVLDLVRQTPGGVRTLLVVGHEPVMSAVAAHLAGEGSDSSALAQAQVGLPTAAYVVVESSQEWAAWSRRSAVLTALVHPEV